MTPKKKSNKESKSGKKKKLVNKLRELRSQLNDLREEENQVTLELADKPPESEKEKPLDQSKCLKEILQLAGIVIKSDSESCCELIFPIENPVGYLKNFYLKIVNNENQIQIDKYILPSCVDVAEILAAAPLKKNDYSRFVMLVKNHIDCFLDRKRQIEELQEKMASLDNCELQKNDTYTRVKITLTWIKHNKTDEIYNINLYLFYDSDTRFPVNCSVTPMLSMELDERTKKVFKKILIKPFVNVELSEGFEKMLACNKQPFSWTAECQFAKSLPAKDNSDSDDTSMDELLQELKEKSRSKKATKTKSKSKPKSKDKKTDELKKTRERKKVKKLDKNQTTLNFSRTVENEKFNSSNQRKDTENSEAEKSPVRKVQNKSAKKSKSQKEKLKSAPRSSNIPVKLSNPEKPNSKPIQDPELPNKKSSVLRTHRVAQLQQKRHSNFSPSAVPASKKLKLISSTPLLRPKKDPQKKDGNLCDISPVLKLQK